MEPFPAKKAKQKVKDVVKIDPTLVSLSKELEYRSLSKLLK
jgi:hypothetical protein